MWHVPVKPVRFLFRFCELASRDPFEALRYLQVTEQHSDVFESRTEIGSKHLTCQDTLSGLSQIFKLIVSTSEKILNNVNTS